MQEHGFSLWIETPEKRILFDTGQGEALLPNSRIMGVDLSTCDDVVLSHGHYDHTGGLPDLFQKNQRVKVYCHPGALLPRHEAGGKNVRSVGIPSDSLYSLESIPDTRIHWATGPCRLSDGIGLTGPIPRSTGYEDTGGAFILHPDLRDPDPMDDDLALWIETETGLIVCVGCSHAGVINTLQYILDLNPGSKIRAVLGGFHMLHASSDRMERTEFELHNINPDLVIPCHCTGDAATKGLAKTMGNRLIAGEAGQVFHF